MSPSYDIKAIVGLISIHLHLQKLSGRSQLRAHSFPANHILRSLMSNNSVIPNSTSHLHHHLHSILLNSLTKQQCGLIKGYIVDMDNRFNEVFPSFDPLNPEFQPGSRIIDNFSHRFSFDSFSKSSNCSFKLYTQQLNDLAIESSSLVTNALVIMDASVKNSVAMSISHIYVHNKHVVKTLHHTVNIISTEVEFFVLCCGKLLALTKSPKSLSSLTHFMLPRKSSTCHLILSRNILLSL